MRALAICGSPRKEGNTEILLRRCLAGLAGQGIPGDLIRLAEHEVKPCTACGKCGQVKDRSCPGVDGDDFAAVFARMVEADIILVGSPVYFGSATPNLMALLDRAGYVARANGGLFSRKLGGPVVVARRAGQNFTFAQLLFWYMINDMVVPGSSYWNVSFGRQVGEVENDAEGLATVDRFAQNLAWLAGKLAG
ncbi:MAG: flavodoxin family protein [Planctomycetes bacterium]|nr:flavodoxin family protein [Planctomycetota bacterium]